MDFHYLLALLSGGVIGLLLGATGGGGSLVAIPLLVYVVGVPVQNATAMSLIVVGYSSLFGAWKESRQQRVHGISALLFSLTGMIGAWVGAQGHQLVPDTLVLFLFGNLLLFISVWTFWKSYEGERNDIPSGCAKEFSGRCALKALIFGWGVGLLTGFFWSWRRVSYCSRTNVSHGVSHSVSHRNLASHHRPHFHWRCDGPFEDGALGCGVNGIGVTRQSSRIDVWITSDSIHSCPSFETGSGHLNWCDRNVIDPG